MSLTVTVAGVVYDVAETSITLSDKIDEQSTIRINVYDFDGTVTFQKYDSILVEDSAHGVLFRGIVNQPQLTQMYYPSNKKNWELDCIDETYRLSKITSDKNYANQYAGIIAADQIQRYGDAEGISGAFALRWDELESEWQQGTLSGTTVTTNASDGNVGDGDLELALAGSEVTVGCSVTADWTTNGSPTSCSASSNQLVPFNYQSIMFSAVNSGTPLGGSTYDYYKIWGGSYTVASGDTLAFIEWINASSPQCMASIDAQCSDGTWISAFNSSAIVDQQNLLKLTATTDLKGYADNQWYTRTFDLTALAGKTINSFYLVFAGSSQGTYTAYFRDISINNPPGVSGSKLWVYQDGQGLNTSNQAQIIGYNNTSVSIVTAYDATATWLSNGNGNISAASIYRTSQAAIVASVPSGTSLLVETSADNGNTWHIATDKTPLSGFLAGQSVSKLYYRLTMSITGNDPTVQAIVDSVQFTIYPSYAATKSDVSSTVSGSGFSSGTLTGTSVQAIPGTIRGIGHSGAFGTNALMLNGFWRVWQGTNINALVNQTLYGATSPVQLVAFNSLQLTTGTGTDVRSRQDYAGSAWQNFTASLDVQIPAGASDSVGFQYRTTNWVNQSNCGGWQVDVFQGTIKLGYGTNTGTSGTYTQISSVNITNLSAGSWHTLTIIANGTSHQVLLDGVGVISVTNSTFNIAGYVGMRAFNTSGSTKNYYFNNFGIVASLSGTYVSPSLSLSSAGSVGSTMISVQNETLPSGTSYTIQTSIDGGVTYQNATNGGAISGLPAGTSLSGISLLVKLTLTTTNASFTPMLDAYTVYVSSAFSSSGTRTTAPIGWDSMSRSNVTGGFGTATNGQTYTKTGTGTVALTSDEATIASTTGNVFMQLGTTTTTDEEATVRFSLSASATTGGIALRYTDANNFYALETTTTTISIVKASGGTPITLASAAVTLSTSVYYRLRFRVVGSVPVELYGRVWADGSSEPSVWNVTSSD